MSLSPSAPEAPTRFPDASLPPHPHADLSWFAVRVRARSEIRVSAVLTCKGYESFAPTYRPARDSRPASPELALFPGYVFCRFALREMLSVVTTPNVHNIVSIGTRPEPIREIEMENIRRSVAFGCGLQPHPYLTIGQRVCVRRGALAGVEGVLFEAAGAHRLVIAANLLQRAVSLHIDRDSIVPV